MRANNRKRVSRTPEELRQTKQELFKTFDEIEDKIAQAEIEQLEKTGQKVPTRLPITDPQSRITPNKKGGFAPNYTPKATVHTTQDLLFQLVLQPCSRHSIG